MAASAEDHLPNSPFLNDLRENAETLYFATDEIMEDVNNLLSLELAAADHDTNEVMRVLTVFSAFFLPLTFIVGVYGMNFDVMPELRWAFGYPAGARGHGRGLRGDLPVVPPQGLDVRKVLAATAVLLLGVGPGRALGLAARPARTSGRDLALQGPADRVEILRDRWGVPHIFAAERRGRGLRPRLLPRPGPPVPDGAVTARGPGPAGRAAGPVVRGHGQALPHRGPRLSRAGGCWPQARPEARAAFAAYAKGVNAGVLALDGRLPPEFTLLRHRFAPVKDDDFLGTLGFMTWGLNQAWTFDPLFEKLVARVGPERAAAALPLQPRRPARSCIPRPRPLA